MKPPVKYCAIYTRKSTEEGLEQEFNTLDAQREACQAYIISQKAEGWSAVKTHYDDGGFSGGNMERPALKKLMDDIQAGKVHIVVVYKIDRLTRSLMDFAKLVEVFDRHGVTFVSITQSFNTTTSMGRLTLNVLLSFAQFEREVTGERIRDKISASKKKGMWMGGMIPFGYDCLEKKLLINQDDSKVVRLIFEKYLALGSVRHLKEYLDNSGILSKLRTSDKGKTWGGAKFSRGLLYKLLINPVYIGRIKHKDVVYDGQHEAILSLELWDQVQALMAQQAATARGTQKSRPIGNLLRGLLFDVAGNKYSPSFTNKGKRQYRYYVSQALLQDRPPPVGIVTRLSAHETETAVEAALKKELQTPDSVKILFALDSDEADSFFEKIIENHERLQMRHLVTKSFNKVVIDTDSVKILIDRRKLLAEVCHVLKLAMPQAAEDGTATITIPVEMIKPKTGCFIVEPKIRNNTNDPFDRTPQELKNWVRGVIWRDSHFKGMTIRQIAQEAGCSDSRVASLIAESFAAA
jgi:DNA invertase Pin-like site-specific DNA recombinase